MNCFKDYVGIKGCGSAPVSGRYVNQLPGISLESVQKIANSEQITFAGVFDEVQDRAWDRFVLDVRNALRARFKIKTAKPLLYIESGTNTETIAPAPNYRGLLINSGADNNGFFGFQVSSIMLNMPAAADTVTVKIFDRTGNLLDTFVLDAPVQGVNTIVVNRSYSASRIFIAVDATLLTLSDTQIGINNWLQPFQSIAGRMAGISGGESTLAMPAFAVPTDSTYGISAVITPVCDYSHLLCADKDLWVNAWMYLLGAELMMERMSSTRINRFTTVDAEGAPDMRDLFTGQYENALQDAVAGLEISAEDACIECAPLIKRVERLP